MDTLTYYVDTPYQFCSILKLWCCFAGEIPIPELLANYPTTCSNIISLSYSPHNTLVAVGVAGGALPPLTASLPMIPTPLPNAGN